MRTSRQGSARAGVALFLAALVILATVMVEWASASVVMQYFRARRESNGSITVEWRTASELDTTAFLLYRSENVNQVGLQVRSEPSRGDSVTGAAYTYNDPASGLTPGRLYYYRLQEVTSTGSTSWHGPIAPSGSSFSNPGTIVWTATPTDPPTATRRYTNTPVILTSTPTPPPPPTQPVFVAPQAPPAPVAGPGAVSTPTPAPLAVAPLPLLATDTPPIPTATPVPTLTDPPTVEPSSTPRPTPTLSPTAAPVVFSARVEGDLLPPATAILPASAAAPLVATEDNGLPWGLLVGGLALVGMALGVLALGMRRSGRA